MLILGATALWSLVSNKVLQGKSNQITWDVYGYYLHLPAYLKYNDIHNYAFVEKHMADYAPSDGPYQITRLEGVITPTYTMGLAILWLPFYLVADAWAQVDPRFPADGISQPYQWMVILAGFLFLALGLYWLALFLRPYLSVSTIIIVLAGITLGTNLFYYAAVEPGMPHVYLFALYAGLLLLMERMVEKPSFLRGVLVGAILAIMALCRPTEALAALLIPGFLVMRFGNFTAAIDHVRSNLLMYGAAVITGLICLLPQLFLWKSTTGQWIYNPYAAAGHTFHLSKPFLLEGLFSFRKGWLIYTPLMALALPGMPLLWTKSKNWSLGITGFVILNIWIVLSWHIWWYAGSFGMRALVQSYALLALPLGLVLEWSSRDRLLRDSLLALVILFSGLNLFQTWQIQNGILKKDGMNEAFYAASFGQLKKDKARYQLMDIPDTPKEPALYRIPIASITASQTDLPHTWLGHLPGWPVKGDDAYSPSIDLMLSDSLAQALAGQWIEVQAEVYAGTDLAPYTQAARLVLDVQREGRERLWYGLHLQRIIELQHWWPVKYEIQLPEDLRAGDRILAVVWSTSNRDDFYLHKMMLNKLVF